MRPRLLVTAALACALWVTLAPTGGARTLETLVYLHEDPLHVAPEVVNARVGDTIVMDVVNTGSAPHNLVVCGDGVQTGSACDDKWAFTPLLQEDQEARLTFTVPHAGTFEYYCDVPGHKAGGMVGRLTVQGDAAERNESPVPAALVLLGLTLAAAAFGRRIP